MKSLVRTVANLILVKPAVPLELDWRNIKKKYKNLNLCTTLGQLAKLLWQSNTSLPLQITLQQLTIPSTGRKLKSLNAKRTSKCTRWLKEAIWIRRRRQQTLNKDEGAYELHNIFDQLIFTTPSAGTSRKYKGAMLSGLGCQSNEAARVAVKRQ